MIQRLPNAPGVGQDGAGAAAYVQPEIDVLLPGRTAMVRRQLAQQIGQLQRLTVDREIGPDRRSTDWRIAST
jgi:hypothetical protein